MLVALKEKKMGIHTRTPFQTVPIPHKTPTAISQNSFLRSCPGPNSVPTNPRARHTLSHMFFAATASTLNAGFGFLAKDRKILFKHSRALMWMPLNADVVGGCTDPAARGGKESDVG